MCIQRIVIDFGQVTHQPEYYDHILCYVKKGAQIKYKVMLRACNNLFLVYNRYIHCSYINSQFIHGVVGKLSVLVGSKISFSEE